MYLSGATNEDATRVSNDEKALHRQHFLVSLQNAVYKGEFTATHPTIRLFWEVFHEFSLEKKKQFLCKHSISSSQLNHTPNPPLSLRML